MAHSLSKDNRLFFVLSGPTAVGKTEVSQDFFGTGCVEFINGDMGQLYKPLSIGTAKPDWKSIPIAHHLFDIIERPVDYTALDYRERVKTCMEEVWERGNIPVVVGGSLFYLRMLFFVPGDYDSSCLASKRGSQPEIDFDRESAWEILQSKDPQRAEQLESANDTYRLKRALELLEAGVLPSSRTLKYEPLAHYRILFLTREREDLYARINRRVVEMIGAGWIEEVKGLSADWRAFLSRKKLIGYSEIITYLEELEKEGCDKTLSSPCFETLVSCIQQRTRRYAKRQMTFWRMLKRELKKELVCSIKKGNEECSIEELDLTLSPLPLYIKQTISDQCRVHTMNTGGRWQ
ncbi:MAG: tRNA dimethylallyltransferase [candidate division TM6 bacterium GW2011_GWF2_43_87]|nr:MAG: tRNA dimethylallyltransferase [candidate division TM6 bacterium GW2011_GWF2_43_87]